MKNKILLLVIGLVFILGNICGCSRSTNEVLVNDFSQLEATDFEGVNIDSSILKEHKATIVNIWYTGCGPCIDEMPYLEKVYQEFKEEDINFIGIATDISNNEENFETAKEIIATQAVTYINLKPTKDSVFEKGFLGTISAFPTTYVVNQDGKIVGNPIVGTLDDYKKEKIKQLIDEEVN